MAEISVGCGQSAAAGGREAGMLAARSALSTIGDQPLSAVLVFASFRYDLAQVLAGIHGVTGEATVIGASSAGELCNGVHHHSVVVVALASPHLRVRCAVGREVSRDWRAAVNAATDVPAVRPYFTGDAEPWLEMTRRGSSAFLLLFTPGSTRSAGSMAFEILETLKTRSMGRLPIVGGAAADDWPMETNYVLYGREAIADGLLLAVFETELQFGIAMTHGFRPTATQLTVTSASAHRIMTVDERPAAEVICEILGADRATLGDTPLALPTRCALGTADATGQYSINVATGFTPRGGVRMAQPVTAGTILTVMEPDRRHAADAGAEVLRRAFIQGGIADPALALVHYCALRPRILGKSRSARELTGMLNIMRGNPLAGFFSAGETGTAADGASHHSDAAVSALVLGKGLSQPARVARENERLRAALVEETQLLEQRVLERTRALKLAYERLRSSEEKYRSLVETLSDCVWEVDPDGVITYISPAVERVLGYTPDELIGKRPITLISPDEVADASAGIHGSLREHKPFANIERVVLHKSGREVHLEISGVPVFDEHGAFRGFRGTHRDITHRKLADEHVRQLVRTDTLTGLTNRAGFLERLAQAFAETRRRPAPFALLFIDLDRFKDINDTLGHPMGDALLKEMAARLRQHVRETDMVARFGGDEFAVLQTGVAEAAGAGTLAEKICAALAAPYLLAGHRIHTTVSIGVALHRPQTAGAEELMTQADLALYRAKDDGGNRYCFHTPDLDEAVRQRVTIADELRLALDQQQMELHYQPQVDATSGRIVGVEALLRWNHPQRGLLMPDAFIAIAEKTGAIVPLGRWVLREACRQAAEWLQHGCMPPALAVNVSARQLRVTGEFERELRDALAQWRLPPAMIELELTESSLYETTTEHRGVVEALGALGVRISIDDFGTGYSSLEYLRTYRVNRLKIAQQFVQELPANLNNQAIVRAAIGLAQALHIEIIAEGVETWEQLAFLRNAGCTVIQGYCYSRPVPAAEVTAMLGRGTIEARCTGHVQDGPS